VIGDEQLLELIDQMAERNYGAYGYPKTWLALQRQGAEVGRDPIKRPMRKAGRGDLLRPAATCAICRDKARLGMSLHSDVRARPTSSIACSPKASTSA
jgi:hypothetical protein